LESIDHYNSLYAMTELCTGLPEVKQGTGRFTFECFDPQNYERDRELWPDELSTAGPASTRQTRIY
jgi:hypothetical protein